MKKKLLLTFLIAVLLVVFSVISIAAAPEGVSISNAKLVGLADGTSYEYQKLVLPEFEIGEYQAYDPATSQLSDPGLYAVRVAGESDYALVLGESTQRGSLTNDGAKSTSNES